MSDDKKQDENNSSNPPDGNRNTEKKGVTAINKKNFFPIAVVLLTFVLIASIPTLFQYGGERNQSHANEKSTELKIERYFGVKNEFEIALTPGDIKRMSYGLDDSKDKYSIRDHYLIKQDDSFYAYNTQSGNFLKEASSGLNGLPVVKTLIALHEKEMRFQKVVRGNRKKDYDKNTKKEHLAEKEETDTSAETDTSKKTDTSQSDEETEERDQKEGEGEKHNEESSDERMDRLKKELDRRIQEQQSQSNNDERQTRGGARNQKDQPTGQSGREPEEVASVAPNQVDVRGIQERDGLVKYKEDVIPKIGFDPHGNPISEEASKNQAKGIMDSIKRAGDNWSVIYPAKGEEKKSIAVLTDPTCPFCRSLHENMDEINEAGVTVHYLFYNRRMNPKNTTNPQVSQLNKMMESAWCSEDNRKAVDMMFDGQTPPETQCSDNQSNYPGSDHYLIGRILNLKGTPHTLTDDGKVFSGFSRDESNQPERYLNRIGM